LSKTPKAVSPFSQALHMTLVTDCLLNTNELQKFGSLHPFSVHGYLTHLVIFSNAIRWIHTSCQFL
jgi:hypothetical protein